MNFGCVCVCSRAGRGGSRGGDPGEDPAGVGSEWGSERGHPGEVVPHVEQNGRGLRGGPSEHAFSPFLINLEVLHFPCLVDFIPYCGSHKARCSLCHRALTVPSVLS